MSALTEPSTLVHVSLRKRFNNSFAELASGTPLGRPGQIPVRFEIDKLRRSLTVRRTTGWPKFITLQYPHIARAVSTKNVLARADVL